MDQPQIDALKQASWIHAKAELAGIESRVRNTMKKDATEADVRALYEAQMVPYVIAHMLRTEAACAQAVQHGILAGPVVGILMASLRGFCQAASAGRKAFCKQAPCEWRGEVSEAGPCGVCPLCSKAPVSILDLTVPPSTNGTHPRFTLVDP